MDSTACAEVVRRRVIQFDRERSWYLTVGGIAVLALLVRLLIIGHTHGGADLRIYTYYSRLVLHGFNPFAPPPDPAFPSRLASNTPLEVALFAGLLGVHDSPTTLRVCFACVEVATLLMVGLAFPRTRCWRIAFIVFYAFNPLVLLAFTVYAEDKTILFLAIAGLMLAVEKNRYWTSWLLTTFLAAFKFFGVYLVPALALDSFRQRRNVLWPLAVFVILVGITTAFWFPDGLYALTRRTGRLDLNPPINASPVLLLARIGIYSTAEPRILPALGILLVLLLFAVRRLEIRETLALTIFAAYVFLPDNAFDRLLLITLPFLLLMQPSLPQWLLLWLTSSVAALGAVVAVQGVPHVLSPIAGPLRTVFSPHVGTTRHVLWMSLFPAVVLATFACDRWSLRRRARSGERRTDEETLAMGLRQRDRALHSSRGTSSS